jgi:3-deoxy-manno-octulosonate cytidylyltransferase (CMP-KDO synthetase)
LSRSQSEHSTWPRWRAVIFRVVVPARYASSRLPGKPLVPLAGKPMIQWVVERAQRSSAQQVVVATDDERIARIARAFADVQMTSAGHPSATDRLAEVAAIRGWRDEELLVNLQGDEPLMPPSLIDQVAELLAAHSSTDIATLAVPLQSSAELYDPNVVKVVTDLSQRALYFSRAPIPFDRDVAGTFAHARRHMGLYAYRVGALKKLAAAPPSALEELEKLEQLRALEHGMEIRVALAVAVPGGDVNTASDIPRVEALLAAGNQSLP